MGRVRGGDKALKHIADLARRLNKKATLDVGFFEDATYPDGTSVAEVAAAQNYGTDRIPARPFFSNMVRTKSSGWPGALVNIMRANDFDADRSLDLLGQGIVEQLQQSIRDTNSPPLAEATLKARGVDPSTKYNPSDPATFGAKPLIHTAVMINSAGHKVKKG